MENKIEARRDREIYPRKMFFIDDKFLDYFIIFILVFLVSCVSYQPYYFGDEATPWAFHYSGGNFFDVLCNLSLYKPRFVFSALWSVIVTLESKRYVAGGVMALAEAILCVIVYNAVRQRIVVYGRFLAFVAVLCVISHRFGSMIWYDYLAGTIETVSACFFIIGICFLFSGVSAGRKTFDLLAGFFFVLACFVHERYAAGALAAGGMAACCAWPNRGKAFIYLVIAVTPLLLFLFATYLMSAASLMTGTAGQEVKLGTETVISFLSYFSNVFLQTNIGYEWMFGEINTRSSQLAIVLSTASAGVFLVIYWLSIKNRKFHSISKSELIIIAAMLALIVVASLPSLVRQEARWVYSVVILNLILMPIFLGRKLLAVFLAANLLINMTYIALGSNNTIWNIKSAKTMFRISSAAAEIPPPGRNIVVIGNSEILWAIGGPGMETIRSGAVGDSREALAQVNFAGARKFIPTTLDSHWLPANADYALYEIGQSSDHVPIFKLINIQLAKLLMGMETDVSGLKVQENVGGPFNWDGWRLPAAMLSDAGLVVHAGAEGFKGIPVGRLAGNVLVYKARALGAEQQKMRLQVNWHDAAGKFISATIIVASLTPVSRSYGMLISPPPGAAEGLIYASVGDDAGAQALIESVDIFQP